MVVKKMTPAIRFKGFSDAWVQCKFGDIVIPYSDPVTTPTHGYARVGIRSHAKGTFHSYVKPGEELGTAKMNKVGANNFIVNITFGWEHAVAITDYNDAGKLVSHRFPQFSFKERMVPKYFKYQILNKGFRDHLGLSSPGGAGRNRVLKVTEMLEYQFWVTSEEEQMRIADFFLNLDKLITLYQDNLMKLENIKRSMLVKMFPKEGGKVPEIRFAGFRDDWVRSDINTWADRYDNLRVPITASDRVSGSTPYYGANGIQDYVKGYTHSGEFILVAEDGANDLKNYPVQYVNGKIWVNNHAHVLQAKKEIADNKFLKYAISQANIEPYLVGGSRSKLNANTMMSISIIVPKKLEEQIQLGTFFQQLDNLINLNQRKLEILENIKKAFLEKMLV